MNIFLNKEKVIGYFIIVIVILLVFFIVLKDIVSFVKERINFYFVVIVFNYCIM